MTNSRRQPLQQRRRPTDQVSPAVPDAPESDEDPDLDESPADDPADPVEDEPDTETVDISDMGRPAEPRTYLPPDKNGTPPDSYILDVGDTIQKDWFTAHPYNDALVVPKQTIIRKVFPPNTITPTYVQLAVAGVPMTKESATRLRG